MVWVVGVGVALFLLFAFPKQMLALAALAALVIAAGVGYLLLENRTDAANKERDQKAVEVTASYDPALCATEGYPILVRIVNRDAKRTLDAVAFDLAAYRPGFSSPVVNASYRNSDKILKPGEGWGQCHAYDLYGLNKPPSDLSSYEWRVERTYPRFEKP